MVGGATGHLGEHRELVQGKYPEGSSLEGVAQGK